MSIGHHLRWWPNSQVAIVGFHPGNLFAWHPNAKRKHKSWLDIVKKKKKLGRGNFVLFLNLFPGFREHPIVFLSLNKIHATKCMQAYIYSISFSYYFHFLLFVSQSNVKFCHKNCLLRSVSHYHWTWNWKSVTDEIWNPRACYWKRLRIIWRIMQIKDVIRRNRRQIALFKICIS